MCRFVTIFKTLFIAAIAGFMFQACDRTPDYVIGPKEMTSLLVDIHKGESVIDLNRSAYSSDSMRKVVKQSIYAKHGVTAEQVDTSLVWYGHNVEKYIEIYDGVIEQLEKDIKNADVSSGGERLHLAVVGDSVDAWSEVPYRHFFNGEPVDNVKFSFSRDENWEKGDVYTWRFYANNRLSTINWTMAVDYTDGTSDYMVSLVNQDGWNELKLVTDSAKTAKYIYGNISMNPIPGESVYLDSISLVCSRFSPSTYFRGNVKEYRNGKK